MVKATTLAVRLPRPGAQIDHGLVTRIEGSQCWWHSDITGTERGPALLPTARLGPGGALTVLTPDVGHRVTVTFADVGTRRIGYATPYGG